MKISNSSWKNYVEKLSKINAKSGELMRQWIETHGTSDTEAMIRYAYAISTKYGEAAAALACDMYDAVATASGKNILPAEPANTATFGETAVAVNGAKLRGDAVIPQAVERLVKLAGQDTTVKNAIRDGAYWAWVPMGDTCSFCITLASNGWQRASNKVLKGGHAEHIHANCDCAFTINFNGPGIVEGYNPDEYLEQYRNAGGDVNAMRRANYVKNKERINAQKRLAYKKRVNIPKPLPIGAKEGILNIRIDEFTPCLKDMSTGKLVDTEVFKISKANLLKGYNEANGWNVDWQNVFKQHDVYALTIKGDSEIQGLIGFSYNKDAGGMYLAWASAAPWNTKQHSTSQRYTGVGGHLFAIAAEKTLEYDKNGYMYGFAKNETVLKHYISKLHAEYIGALHQYHMIIDTPNLYRLLEEYNYEWRK